MGSKLHGLAGSVVLLVLAGCGPWPVGGGTGGGTGGSGGGTASTAKFAITLDPASVSVGQGGVATITLALSRSGDSGAIALTLEGAPPGVTGAFDPSSATADTSVLTLLVAPTTGLGNSTLTVKGTGSSGVATATLPLTVTVPVGVLLVDDDRSQNNDGRATPAASASDSLYRNLLSGTPFNLYVVPSDSNGPSFEQLKNYQTVIWYSGSQYGATSNVNTISSSDEAILKAFLDQGGRKLVIFASSYFYGQPSGNNWTTSVGPFLSQYVGAQGIAWDCLNHQTYTTTGVGPMAGISMMVADDAPVNTYTDPINPAPGTEPFFTADLDPGTGVVAATAIASGRKNVGTAGSSTVIQFGFPFENLTDIAAPNTRATIFTRVLAY